MSGRAGPSGRNRYAGVGVSVGRTGVAVGTGVAVQVVVGVAVTVGVSVGVGVAVSVGAVVAVDVLVGVSVEVVVGIGVHVGVNAAVEVSVGTTDSETTGWGMDVPGPQAPIPIALRMIIIPITDLGFFHMSLNRPSSHCKPRIT
jgi:hypothetical protein